MGNLIDFANAILINEKTIQDKLKVYCSPRKYKNNVSYGILTDISEHVTLVKFMDYSGNVNHAITVVGYCIFESN